MGSNQEGNQISNVIASQKMYIDLKYCAINHYWFPVVNKNINLMNDNKLFQIFSVFLFQIKENMGMKMPEFEMCKSILPTTWHILL